MINIFFLTSLKLYQNTIGIIYPLIKWKNQIYNEKINFKIVYKIDEVKNCDIIIVDSKFHRNYWLKNKNKIYDDFKILKKKCRKLIYCDSADSSGWIQSEIFNYIDKYWKCQILKDKKLYLNKYYDRRIFTDFYYNQYKNSQGFRFTNEKQDWSTKLNAKDLAKIEVFWNTSIADYSLKSYFFNLFTKKFLNKIYINKQLPKNYIPNFNKQQNIFFNFNINYPRYFIAFQRKKLIKIFNVKNLKRINRMQYFSKLKDSKICLSPFGWGEITIRDYECFLCGSILLKPNMSHIETWPNLYIKNKTYIDFNWDLNNMEQICDNIINNYENYIHIAHFGQQNYAKYLNGEKAELYFVNRLKKLINNL